MDLKDLLDKGSAALGGKPIAGLLFKQARINNGKGTEVKDILGWDCIVRAEDGTCYSFYVAQPPNIGMTKPVQIQCPLGIQVFDSYKIDIEEAIKILNKRDCGDTFVDIKLSWPLVPDCKEPYWHFRLTLGNEVSIGANTGTGSCHKFKELLKNTQELKVANIDISDININVGEWTKVELEDNHGSTGYSWVIGHKPDPLWLIESYYIPPENPMPGKPGKRVFTFYGAEKCQDSIQFIQVQLWNPKSAEITSCAVNINEGKGIRITPEIIEKARAAKSPKELTELGKGYGFGLDEKAAEKLFAKLNSGELAAKELSSVAAGSCFEDKCPACGSNDVYKQYVPISPTDGTCYCHCNHCGYNWVIG